MRKKLAWLLVGTMVLGTVLLGGCEKKATPESLIKDMNAKLESAKSYEAVMDMDMSMNVEAEGIGMDIDMGMAGEIEATMEPAISHMNMTLEMSLLGLSLDMDMYTQIEDGQVAVYTGMAGEWMKTVQELTEETDISNISVNVGDPAKLTLAEETETLDGGEAYVLTGTISGAELQEVIGSAESMMEGLGDIDLTGVQADMTLWIYKDTGYPASMEVIMSGDGLSAEAEGVTTSITNLTVVMDYVGFDTIDSIEIPAEALAAEEVDPNALVVQ